MAINIIALEAQSVTVNVTGGMPDAMNTFTNSGLAVLTFPL